MSAQRILVVDDSPFTGQAVALALRGAGFIVQVAGDMWDLEREDIARPDLVLMDVVLQEAFGDDLAMLLRVSRGFDCPIVLLSSLPENQLEQRAADAELDGFISKRVGLAGIVARARALLGNDEGSQTTTTSHARFDLIARQRVRRIIHVTANNRYWNATAMAAEAHALAGDADLVGASAVADAARACRDVAQTLGSGGSTPEIAAALEQLADAVPGSRDLRGILLVATSGDFYEDDLLPELDKAGYVVVQASSSTELRPKLHAAEFDLAIVDAALTRTEPALLGEVRGATDAPIALLTDSATGNEDMTVFVRTDGGRTLLAAIDKLVKRRAA